MTFVTGPVSPTGMPGMPRQRERLRGYRAAATWSRRRGFQGLGGWTMATTTWPRLQGGTVNVGDTVTLPSSWGDKVTGVLQNLQLNPTTVVAAIPYTNPTGNYATTDPFANKGYFLTLWGNVVDLKTGRAFPGNDPSQAANLGPYVPPSPDMAVPTPAGVVAYSSTIPVGGVTNVAGTELTPTSTAAVIAAANQKFQTVTSTPATKTPAPAAPPAVPNVQTPPAQPGQTITVKTPPMVAPAISDGPGTFTPVPSGPLPPYDQSGQAITVATPPALVETALPVNATAPSMPVPAAATAPAVTSSPGAGLLASLTGAITAHPLVSGAAAFAAVLLLFGGRRGNR